MPLTTSPPASVDAWEIQTAPTAKRASGRLRLEAGQCIGVIRLPRGIRKAEQERVVAALKEALLKQVAKTPPTLSTEAPPLVQAAQAQGCLALHSPAELLAYVNALNAATFGIPLKHLRIGNAKRSSLAYAQPLRGSLTFSRYCLGDGIPAAAFRYLVLHELAHFKEANHSPRFWALVEPFCPDYKQQHKIIQAFFRWQVAIGGGI